MQRVDICEHERRFGVGAVWLKSTQLKVLARRMDLCARKSRSSFVGDCPSSDGTVRTCLGPTTLGDASQKMVMCKGAEPTHVGFCVCPAPPVRKRETHLGQ